MPERSAACPSIIAVVPLLASAGTYSPRRLLSELQRQSSELAHAWRKRGDNPLPALWQQMEQRARSRRPWYRREPLLLGCAVLVDLAYIVLLLWFFGLQMRFGQSSLITSDYLIESLGLCLRLLVWPLLVLAAMYMLIRIYDAMQFCLSLLSFDPRARGISLDEQQLSSPLTDSDLLIAALWHALRKIALPLLLYAIGTGVLVTVSLSLGDDSPLLGILSSEIGQLPWPMNLACGVWTALATIMLGLPAACFCLLLLIALGRGLSPLHARLAAAVQLIVQLGAIFFILLWAVASAQMNFHAINRGKDLVVSLTMIPFVLLQLALIGAACLTANSSLRVRQAMSIGLWPLLSGLTFQVFITLMDWVEDRIGNSDLSPLSTTPAVQMLNSPQLMQSLPVGMGLQGSLPQMQVAVWMQLGLNLLLAYIALLTALGAIRLHRGRSE